MKVSVREILRATGGQLISGFPTSLCEGISIDTRTIKKGDVFFAIQGPRFDGHEFIALAAEKGAQAVVIHRLDSTLKLDLGHDVDIIQVPETLKALQDTGRFIRHENKRTRVIGITGSNGKTTTKEMLACILRRAGKTLATRGNLNNQIGLPLMLSELEQDHRFAIFELGTSHAGDMKELLDMAHPHVGLLTNVGKDHLEYLGTPEGVLRENRGLFDELPKDGAAIINLEDPLLKSLAKEMPCKTVTYGRVPEAMVSAEEIVPFPIPLRFTLVLSGEKRKVNLQTVGDMQVLNAMAAAATALALGISADDIVEGLQSFKPIKMRMEVHERADKVVLVNDAYNANPSSMRVSIESFCRSYPDRPRWLVLGDMRELGKISREEHDDLGRWIAEQAVEKVFLYGRDTRFILKGMTTHGFQGVVERYHKKRYLIEALGRSFSGDSKPAVLFKASRSLQLEQVSHALLSIPS